MQTGHFPDNISINPPSDSEVYEESEFVMQTPETTLYAKYHDANPFNSNKREKNYSKSYTVIPDGWEGNPSKGVAGLGGVEELPPGKVTITSVDSETGDVLGSYEIEAPSDSATEVDYRIDMNKLLIDFHLEVGDKFLWEGNKWAFFQRSYKIFIRRKKINAPQAKVDVSGLLITQRKLCTQITYNECISSKDVTTTKLKPIDTDIVDLHGGRFDDIVVEIPFDITPLFELPEVVDPSIFGDKVRPPRPRGQRNDFPFKKESLE
ncbi:MAG: hypothetical protein IPI98_14970 [Chitinophagaceae bacterium]|nr:hypothetical protein [Chitinophagaceae bacterium]